jgi:D-beta-D-heptose 7-phosphate kinase/D-beta-D-heptose 1-phosphate adenosyltransferase
VDVTEENYRLGGAANVALNMGTLGIRASLFGRIGDDSGGRFLKSLLADAAIGWLGDKIPPAAKTIVKTRVVAHNQQLCRLDREGRREEYTLDEKAWATAMTDLLADVDGVIVSDYAKGVIDDTMLPILMQHAGAKGIPVCCDPKPRFARDFRGMHLLTPNKGEAIQLSGVEWDTRDPFPAEKVVETIFERYNPRYLVITLGPEGMLYAENGKVGGLVPTFAREVYDVSGAGDTVIAALSASLLAGASLEESVSVANLAAGIVVGKLGTATADREEILAYARRHAEA